MAIESVGGSIISKIAELMVEPVGRQFRYMFCFNDFVKEFKQQKEKLVSEKERLQDDVKDAERNAEEIYEDVKKWLGDAENEIEGAKPLENEIGKNGKCFTWCPKCMRQFKFSKALAKKSETFRELLEKKSTKVSHRTHPQPIEFLQSKEFTPSKSSEEAFEHIMEALKDDKVNMIGLCGMGGVGKTTLVRKVGTIARESQLFDEVLMATVSQNPNVTDIQNQMADKLGLDITKNSKEGRADRLWQRLKKVEKMLIILDDVWKVIDFQEIGIPLGDGHRGCKILLTTRLQGICSYMECRKKVLLSPLPEKEAWDLFRINAGLRDGDSTLNTVAREVARECQGLPIALVTVGKALRDKSEVEWEVAFGQLKNSQFPDMEHIDEQRTAYACLKLSYDYLKSKETKLCFLICCLFPEDYNIPIEELTRYAVGYELHQEVESTGDAKKRVYVEIKKLKDCCLLLDTEIDEHVKMHDLVRDVAIRIASSKEYGFMVKAGIGLKEWPMSIKSFEACTTISLMGNKLSELPEGLECPQLKVLLLELDDGMNVPEKFFEGMKEIEVLSLKGGCLSLQSLELSTKLQSLVLIRCGCKDLIWLRKLQRLKILVFQWCSTIKELPDEIGELKELRLLDVRDCRRLRRIPVNLIGRLRKLEELLIGKESFEEWDVDGCDNTGGKNASLTELNSLSQLAVLSLRIPKVECIPRDFVFPDSLRKYHIILGNADGYYRMFRDRYPTSLILGGPSLNAKTFEQLFLHKLESVDVWRCGDVFTLFPARLRQGLKNLKEVIVDSCKSLEEVFEFGEEKELPLLSSLTKLQMSGLPELKCIWKGPTRHVSLQSLTLLNLDSLDKLTFIFTPSLAQSLPKLEGLYIIKCGELEHIIREEDGEREIIPESPGFPKLKKIFIEDCGKLEYVFPVSLSHNRDGIIKFPQLQSLEISYCPELKHIIREEDGEREIIPESPGFPKLKYIIIAECGKLEYVLPVSVSPSLLNLEEMWIFGAHNLKQIFYSVEGDALATDGIIKFPRLRKLSLSSRSNYSFFGPKNFAAQLPSLQYLKIDGHKELGNLSAQLQVNNCGDVRAPFPAKLLSDLKNLRKVEIKDCKSLEEVFELGELPDEGSSEEKELPLLSSLIMLQLQGLPEVQCIWKGPTKHVSLQNLAHLHLDSLNKLTFIFTPSLARSLPKLESLYIVHCHELKHIIREEDGEREIIPESPCFPQLKTIIISECGKLEYVFPVSVSPSLLNLGEMRIFKAHNLKQIFYSGEGDALTRDAIIKFPKLREFSISNCSFFGPKNFVAQLPSLQILEINGHKELGNLSAQLQGLTNLKELRLESLPDMSKLTTSEVNNCGDVRAPFPAKLLPDLKNLRKVEIKDCKSLEEVFELGELPDEGSSEEKELPLLSSLTLLELRELPELKCIWKGPTRHVSLQNLIRLELMSLDKLTFIFTPSLAQSLPKLETLEIKTCGELKHIIREEDGEREIIPESPRFPELKTLYISHCGKLEYVFPVSMSLQGLTNLKALSLKSLPDMRCIWKGLVLSKLTTLEMAAHEQQNGSVQRLEFVQVDYCGDVRAPFPAKSLQALKNLSSVEIKGCKSLEEVFELGEADEGSTEEKELLSSLTMLQLRRLPELKCIWKGPTRHVSLQSLILLDLDSLHKLTFIFTASLAQSLPKLEVLYIIKCGELEHIIREEDGEREIIPESPYFPQLKALFIENCGKLEYVLPVSLSHNRDGIIKFPQLRELSLQLGSNYSFLSPRNFDAQLPLQKLTIEGHEEVGNWLAQLQQNGSLQRLEYVRVNECGDVRAPFPAKLLRALNNLRLQVSISTCKSLEEVFELGEPDEGSSEEKVLPLLSSLTELRLSCLPELKCIWKGPPRHVSLHSLNLLFLTSVDKLTFIFTPSLARSLPKLKRLYISKCGQLKHIIREEDGEREIIPESPGQDDQASPINVEKEIVLPNLKELSLEQLSSIVCFSFGWCDYFLFPRLEKLKVHQCPKLTTKFATTPDGSMSAQSEVPEVAEDSSINREWTRDNGWKEEEEVEEEEDGDGDD